MLDISHCLKYIPYKPCSAVWLYSHLPVTGFVCVGRILLFLLPTLAATVGTENEIHSLINVCIKHYTTVRF